jgi:hypothetical protein
MLTTVLSLILAATASPPLRLDVTTPKRGVAAYEPVKIRVRVTANRDVVLPSTSSTAGQPGIETWIDSGQGFVQYRDMDGCCEGVSPEGSLKAGQHFVQTVVLVEGAGWARVPFPEPGRYVLRLVVRGASERDPKEGRSRRVKSDRVRGDKP